MTCQCLGDMSALEDSPATIRARIKSSTGALVIPSDISSISYKIFRGAVEEGTGSLTPSAVLVNPALTDDAIGAYNFESTIPATDLPEPGSYILELLFTPIVGSAFYLDPIAFEVEGIQSA